MAAWNFHERPIHLKRNSQIWAGKDLLKIFHFTSYDVLQPERVGKNTPLNMDSYPNLRPVFSKYHQALLKMGQEKHQNLPYKLSVFSNGVKIPEAVRWYLQTRNLSQRFPNPFDADGEDSFFNYLFLSEDSQIPNILNILRAYRSDLGKEFPTTPQGNASFLSWYKKQAHLELHWDRRIYKLLELNLGFVTLDSRVGASA